MNLWQMLQGSRSAGRPLGLADLLGGQSPLPAFTPQSYLQPFTPNLKVPQPAPAPQPTGPLSFTGQQFGGPGGLPGIGLGGLADASRGWSPGMDANGWSGLFGLGFGSNDGSSGWGGLLGNGLAGLFGLDVGAVGYDRGAADSSGGSASAGNNN